MYIASTTHETRLTIYSRQNAFTTWVKFTSSVECRGTRLFGLSPNAAQQHSWYACNAKKCISNSLH